MLHGFYFSTQGEIDMKVKDLIKWFQEKNPEADIYVARLMGQYAMSFED